MTRLILRTQSGDYDFGSETDLPLVKKITRRSEDSRVLADSRFFPNEPAPPLAPGHKKAGRRFSTSRQWL